MAESIDWALRALTEDVEIYKTRIRHQWLEKKHWLSRSGMAPYVMKASFLGSLFVVDCGHGMFPIQSLQVATKLWFVPC